MGNWDWDGMGWGEGVDGVGEEDRSDPTACRNVGIFVEKSVTRLALVCEGVTGVLFSCRSQCFAGGSCMSLPFYELCLTLYLLLSWDSRILDRSSGNSPTAK